MANYLYRDLGIMLDLDNWQKLNDNFGDVATDLQLQKADYDAKLSTQQGEYNGKFGEVNARIDGIKQEISGEVLAEVIADASLIRQTPVDTFADLDTVYPTPETGWAAMTRDTGKVYRYNGTEWLEVEDIDPTAINEVDSRLTSQLAETASIIEGLINIEQEPRLPLEMTDDARFNRLIQKMTKGSIIIPSNTMYEVKAPIHINKEGISLLGLGVSKIRNTGTTDTILIETDDLTVVPFFTSIMNLDLEGNINSGHGIKVSHAYNVDISYCHIRDHGLDGIYSLHGMNSSMFRVRLDRNRNGFQLDQVGDFQRSTTWSLMHVYCGTNRNLGGILRGGDHHTLFKPLFEGNVMGGLYVTHGETQPTIIDPYFEFNGGYSMKIDSGYGGNIQGGRFVDEDVSAHIDLADTDGWLIQSTYHSENVNGTGVNVRKSYAGGTDILINCTLPAATPISENAGSTKVLDREGFLDRFKISTNDDLRINGAGNGVIVNNGQYNYRISVDASGQVVATIL